MTVKEQILHERRFTEILLRAKGKSIPQKVKTTLLVNLGSTTWVNSGVTKLHFSVTTELIPYIICMISTAELILWKNIAKNFTTTTGLLAKVILLPSVRVVISHTFGCCWKIKLAWNKKYETFLKGGIIYMYINLSPNLSQRVACLKEIL